MKHPYRFHAQRGAAALIVTLLLFLALALVAFGMNRHLLVEQRSATHHARAAQAFEAAEAGLDWAQARLNDTRPSGADCGSSADAAATTFRTRYLQLDRVSGAITPTPLPAACVREATGWTCRCNGPSVTGSDNGALVAPAFALKFEAAPRAGTVRVVSNASASPESGAHTEATLALFGGLRTAPDTAITTRDVTGHTPDQFFADWFGTDKAAWRDQPVVARIACAADCTHDVAEAVRAGHALVWIDGDATLTGPLTLGSALRPVALVVGGTLRLGGGVALHGVVYAGSAILLGTDNRVQGALLSEGGYAGPVEPAVLRDGDVLTALIHQTGSFVRIPGSWRDF